jgi:hypothetical protein
VTTTQDLAHVLAQYQRLPRHCPAVHTIGNHCLKFLPREKLLKALGMPASYYRVPLTTGWALLVLDTTDLSTHGWAKGSPEARAAEAYLREHGGADRIQRYNGGIGSTQQAWLEAELALAHATETRLIVASHHCLAHGACRETHRAWNGDAIAGMLEASQSRTCRPRPRGWVSSAHGRRAICDASGSTRSAGGWQCLCPSIGSSGSNRHRRLGYRRS